MKEKYDFFRSLYEEEERTAVKLEGRAKVYLSINTAFLIALVIKDDFALGARDAMGLPWWAMLIQSLLLGASLILTAVLNDFPSLW